MRLSIAGLAVISSLAMSCGGQVSAADQKGDDTGCSCPSGQVWRNHVCLPTYELGCGPSCEQDPACGADETCEACGAASSCATRDCRATCVATKLMMGPVLPEALRIRPTAGPAGVATEVTVEGYPWYIGALGYGVRVGEETVVEFGGGESCAFSFVVPPRPAGDVPIWVSQYGSSTDWVLAGVFSFGGGTEPACVQPGFPCTGADTCCGTPDAPVSCTQGRCRAK